MATVGMTTHTWKDHPRGHDPPSKEMQKKSMEFNRNTLTLTYGNMKKKLDNTAIANVKEYNYLNGELLSYHYDYTYNSPYMKAKWDSGVIEVTYGDYVRVMDFMNITDVTTKKSPQKSPHCSAEIFTRLTLCGA